MKQMVRVVGGKGIDSFVALAGGDESHLSILDMEAAETITTTSEFNVVTERARDTFSVRNAEGDYKVWSARVPENRTLQQLFDQSGNNMFVCMP